MRGAVSTYAAVVGTVLTLVGGLITFAPNVPDWIIFVGGLTLAGAGFVGVARGVIRNGNGGRPGPPTGSGREG